MTESDGAGSAIVDRVNAAISAAAKAPATAPTTGREMSAAEADSHVSAVEAGTAAAVAADPAVDLTPSRAITDNDVLGITTTEDFTKQMDASMNGKPSAPEAPKPPVEEPKPHPRPAKDLTPTGKKWKLGTREFDSPEALEAFANGLDANKADLAAQFAAVQEGLKPKPVEINPADIMFEDPQKAVALIEARAEARFKAELEARDRAAQARRDERQAWDGFYNDHPELKGFENDVQSVLPALVKEKSWNAATPFDVWSKALGERVNSRLDKIAEQRRPGVALSSKPAVTATTHPADVERQVEVPVVVDFSEQIKQARRKGKLAHS